MALNPPGLWLTESQNGDLEMFESSRFMIDPDSIGVLKEIKLGCHDGNLGELFSVHDSYLAYN